MEAILATTDKDGKLVQKGQKFFAEDKKQADKLICLGRAKLREGVNAKSKKRKNNSA